MRTEKFTQRFGSLVLAPHDVDVNPQDVQHLTQCCTLRKPRGHGEEAKALRLILHWTRVTEMAWHRDSHFLCLCECFCCCFSQISATHTTELTQNGANSDSASADLTYRGREIFTSISSSGGTAHVPIRNGGDASFSKLLNERL